MNEARHTRRSSPPSALAALHRLRAPNGGGIYASDGDLFNGTIFGRDSCEAAEDLLHIMPSLARDVIRSLAGFQASEVSPGGAGCTEAEPGRIHHEARLRVVGGRPPVGAAQELFARLSREWRGNGEEMIRYDTVDATPLFIRLVARYCAMPGGTAILDETVVRRGTEITIRDSVSQAVDWVVEIIGTSSLGMLEIQRRNVPYGCFHQGWKDSWTAYVHLDGTVANHDAPSASIEVQGLAYDALLGGAAVLADRRPADARLWQALAERLRERVLTTFWMPEQRYFAQAVDRDPGGYPRLLRTITSSPAVLLDTSIFDGLPEERRRTYIGGIVERIFGPEFLTPVGIRCRRLGPDGDVISYFDYHGARTVWIKETYDIAKGLRRQGFESLADELECRILNAVNVAGEYLEFFYVHDDGSPVYQPVAADGAVQAGMEGAIVGTNVPDTVQAWTVSAVLAVKHRNGAGTG